MKNILLIAALISLLPAPLLAETLGEMAAAHGTTWIIGKWTTEDGNATLTYSWKLEKNVVGVTFKMGEIESEGMILRKPGTDTVIYGSADNRGGMSVGKWSDYNDHPTLISTRTKQDGTEEKMAAEHIETDSRTMTVKLYAVGADGQPDSSQSREVIFKRQP